MSERSAVRMALAALATAALLLAACNDTGSAPGGEPLGRVAFVRDGDLWVADADGSDGRKLIDADSLDLGDVSSPKPASGSASAPYIERPEWSADGEWLSFAVPRPILGPTGGLADWFRVFVVRLGGTDLMEVWGEAVRSYEPGFYGVRDWKWSPVGAELATAAFGAPAGSFYVRVFDPAKQGDAWPFVPQNLTSGFRWLPDGSRIAVDLGGGPFDPSPVQNYRLVLYGRTDSPGAPYTGQEEPVYEYQGAFTSPRLHSIAPDGSRILLWDVLATSTPSAQPLSAVSLDGSGAKAHIIDTYYSTEWAAAWSPDSTAIAGVLGGGSTGWQGRRLFVATADGGHLLDNTGEEMADTHPAWSPDASRIAFVRAPERPENAGLGEGHIWITPRDGPPVQVTDDPAYTERYPQWSPDGASILFVRLPADASERETVTPELWAMSPDGANQRKLLELGDMPGTTALMTDDWGHSFDWKPIGEKPTAQSPTATPPTPSPSLSPGTSAAAASAVPLRIGPEIPFPENTALIIETGCWQCDGPAGGLIRVYRRPGGDFAVESLLDSILPVSRTAAEGAPAITGYAIAPELSEMVVGVCIRGTCATDGLYSWSPDSVLAIYRSLDGGITWEKRGEIPAGVGMHGIVGPGRYLVGRSEVRNEVTYEIFPGGEQVHVPSPAKWILDVVDGQPLWWTEEDYSRVLRQNGTTFADFGYDTHVWRASSDGSTTVLVWTWMTLNQTSYFITLVKDSTMSHYHFSGVAMALPYRDGLILANVYASRDSLPSVVDVNAGVVSPLGEPFTKPDFPSGRNYIVGFQTGPFARVVNTGSCLNIRDAPSLDSSVLTCAADGVLLHIDSAAPPAPGWLTVTTPSGMHGYASTQYLEIPFP